jgi:LppP/LprE lipoprotein
MRRGPLTAITMLAGACAVLAAGCGSSTKTVSVSGAPPPSKSTGTTPSASTDTTGSTAGAPAQTTTSEGAASSTRTAPAPAFTNHGATGGGEALGGALALVRAKGFTASDPSQYHPDQTLRVLVGTRSGSGDGYGQQAFFFVDGRYIGTDAKEPSATLRVVSQSDTEVVLAYPLYRHGDPLAHPSGGQATVRFALNDGQLTPLGTIPPVSSQSAFGRQ